VRMLRFCLLVPSLLVLTGATRPVYPLFF